MLLLALFNIMLYYRYIHYGHFTFILINLNKQSCVKNCWYFYLWSCA